MMDLHSAKDRRGRTQIVSAAVFAASACLVGSPAAADHSWSTYHWQQPSGGSKSLPLGDNVDSSWDKYLGSGQETLAWRNARAAWDASSAFYLSVEPGLTIPKRCRATAGRVEVCNAKYGNTGWLGIAQIWLSGGHITHGVTKLNDTYFLTARHNTPHWRSLVMCQEIGHTLGLGHQDEDFNNGDVPDPSEPGVTGTQTCMDYTNAPAGNEEPNIHDFEQLVIIYNNHDSPSAAARQAAAMSPRQLDGGVSAAEWGRPVKFTRDGKPHVYVKELGLGRRLVTDVFWVR